MTPSFQNTGHLIHNVYLPEIFAQKGFNNAARYLPVDGRKILYCLQIGRLALLVSALCRDDHEPQTLSRYHQLYDGPHGCPQTEIDGATD